MLLLLMRHGVAVPLQDSSDGTDEKRSLTPKGRKKVAAVAQALRLMGINPDCYYSSPRLRAVQTAEEVREVFGTRHRIRVTETLDFESTWEAFAKELKKHSENKKQSIVLASTHDPVVSEFASAALVGTTIQFPFRKGAILGIRWKNGIHPGEGEPVLYLTSRIARNLLASFSGELVTSPEEGLDSLDGD